MTIMHTSIRTDRGASLTVFLDSELHTLTSMHPHFEQILDLLADPDTEPDDIRDLMHTTATQGAAQKMRQLSDRVSYDGTSICFDDKPIHGSLVENIKALLRSDDPHWKALVNFLERQDANPSSVSRAEMYDWLSTSGLLIAEDGRFIAYKGLTPEGTSVHAGGGYVDGQWVDGQVPNTFGSIISMPRRDVDDDRRRECSHGLHVGTYRHATGFVKEYQNPVIATVLVDPADVVSVPQDFNCAKMRVSSYEIIKLERDRATELARSGIVDRDTFPRINQTEPAIDDDDDLYDYEDPDNDDIPQMHDFT